jgi:transposase InsO family protein
LLAEVLVGASRLEEGLRALEQAIEVARRHNELFYEAELERLRGELLGRGKAEVLEIEACFWGAMARAQRQQGRSLELRAASSLARLWREQGKRAEAHDVLAPVYGWFTEGFDAPDLIEANQLLEALV